MHLALFTHSLRSDWNHGNAHFLRGVVRALLARGHEVTVHEPIDAWSFTNLMAEPRGPAALKALEAAYPELEPIPYQLPVLDLDQVLARADVVLVHEWNPPELVRRIGLHRRSTDGYALLFHDTHHRSVTAPREIEAFELRNYDGVLAFGEVIRRRYLERGWARRAWTWHEAADPSLFRPLPQAGRDRDLVWIGNWGDGERGQELEEYLLGPAARLGLSGTIHGVRYPSSALQAIARTGLEYRGWLPNLEAPAAFARHKLTVHVPRRPYVEALPGIPTIRVFEALAAGIPLVCAPWQDAEGLFCPGRDYLQVTDGGDMQRAIRELLTDGERALELAEHGRRTLLARHTCAHRADELLEILSLLGVR